MTASRSKSFKISLGLHAMFLSLLVMAPFFSRWRRTEEPHELVMHVDLQVEAPPAPVARPEPPRPVPEPPRPPPEPPPPAPEPPPPPPPEPPRERVQRPPIEVSRRRVRRDAPAPEPTQQAPSPEQVRRQLQEALPTRQASATARDEIPAWYYQLVHQVMFEQWQQPSDLAAAHGRRTRVRIRVARDGRVLERTMVSSSGVPRMDSSVMAAVGSVSSLDPLPGGFSGAHTDITIDFELTGSR